MFYFCIEEQIMWLMKSHSMLKLLLWKHQKKVSIWIFVFRVDILKVVDPDLRHIIGRSANNMPKFWVNYLIVHALAISSIWCDGNTYHVKLSFCYSLDFKLEIIRYSTWKKSMVGCLSSALDILFGSELAPIPLSHVSWERETNQP